MVAGIAIGLGVNFTCPHPVHLAECSPARRDDRGVLYGEDLHDSAHDLPITNRILHAGQSECSSVDFFCWFDQLQFGVAASRPRAAFHP